MMSPSTKILSAGLKLVLGLGFVPFALAQGTLTPLAAPGATMKTLDQIYSKLDTRSAITGSGAVTISQPGSYYLTTNITISSGNAVTIATNEVTLDLNGFTISSTAAPAAGYGILLNGDRENIAIHNGFIRGAVTNNGAGVYSGNGLGYGISSSGGLTNARVTNVSVSGCMFHGIFLGLNATAVDLCTINRVGSFGIYADTVSDSTAIGCGSSAVSGNTVSNCRGVSNIGTGVYAGYTAQNCVGQSSTGEGVAAFTANNCHGTSVSGIGVNATVANNCVGRSTSQPGLSARAANNCFGGSISGRGISSDVANGCYGQSGGSATGIHAIFTVTSSYGISSNGLGIYGTIGSASFGQNNSGYSVSLTHKYNMP